MTTLDYIIISIFMLCNLALLSIMYWKILDLKCSVDDLEIELAIQKRSLE